MVFKIVTIIIDPPTPPISPYYTITSYNVLSFSVLLEWSYPHNDGGARVSNYTITMKSSHTLNIYVERGTTLHLLLHYNKMHTVQIAAMSCVGTSPPVYANNIHAGKMPMTCILYIMCICNQTPIVPCKINSPC